MLIRSAMTVAKRAMKAIAIGSRSQKRRGVLGARW